MSLWLLLTIGIGLSVALVTVGFFLWLPRHSPSVRDLGIALLTGATVSTAVFVVEFLFDSRRQDREERSTLQLELSRQNSLIGADLADRDLAHFFLQGKVLEGAHLARAKLIGANLREAKLGGADLASADLADADLTDAHLEYANLNGADLREANLERAQLGGAQARHADFSGSRLVFASLPSDLRNAAFTGANLSAADLRRANLRGADLRGANLEDALLSRAVLEGSLFDGRTKFPAGFREELPKPLQERCRGKADGRGAPRSTTAIVRELAASVVYSLKDEKKTSADAATCVLPNVAWRDSRTHTPELSELKELLDEKRPERWSPAEPDPYGFKIAAPRNVATLTGEDLALGSNETLASFVTSTVPQEQDFPQVRIRRARAIELLDGTPGCTRRYSYRTSGGSRTAATDLYFVHGGWGFIFTVKADSEVFALYEPDFQRFFDALHVVPDRSDRTPDEDCGD